MVVTHHDRSTGAFICIAIHSSRLGPATGGTRMKAYPDLAAALGDALRLSAAMTRKFAVPGMPRGGGKAVIALPRDFDQRARPDLLRRYGALVRRLNGLYYTAPDVGTTSDDMDIVAETGAPYVFGRTPSAGGMGNSGPITGLGVFAGIQVVGERVFGDVSPRGRRILVQGTGQVGGTLIDYLRRAGAVVLFSEISEAAVRRFRDQLGLTFVGRNDGLVVRARRTGNCGRHPRRAPARLRDGRRRRHLAGTRGRPCRRGASERSRCLTVSRCRTSIWSSRTGLSASTS